MDEDELEAFRSEILRKLQLPNIRNTLAFAGLFQITHELIKWSVIDRTKSFFGFMQLGDHGEWFGGREAKAEYEQKVLSRVPKKPFSASLSWLMHMGAISNAQSLVLKRIYDHRHDLTHELLKYVVDVSQTPDASLLLEAVSIFKSLDRFWLEVEAEIGMLEEHGDVSLEEVSSGTSLALSLCLQAYLEGLEGDREV